MTSIDQLLARALLMREPGVPRDVVTYEDGHASGGAQDVLSWPSTSPFDGNHPGRDAAYDLRTLCETVVTRTAATSLSDFVTEQLPDPRGARVLGCILHLADSEDGARFWWQYAAGAGDDVASYCLYLHHLALGETHAAAWWGEQTRIDTQPAPETVNLPGYADPADNLDLDSSTPTVLRVLGRLLSPADRSRTEVVTAVMEYVPSAVAAGYVDNPDFEIPLPGPHFADHIAIILAAAPGAGAALRHRRKARSPSLRRRPDHTRADTAPEDPARGGHR
ncbi:hypothetical protein [Streptomyces sp. H39-S7]|uniref:hypothetical protein n=1 Tax=Streptomyces sp. H39-S7 TaxID=3004357 RepID=UPI0022AFE75C|nr:hypothetical protein [Streptomyces sp. H39-S7]MCZ4121860.1 hypothetical protein [Streptomyces sp. H39-S7]